MIVAAAMTMGLFALSVPSEADVTAVQGSAYAYQTNVSLFGGPSVIRGFNQITCTAPNVPPNCGPTTAESPSVTLPPTGSGTPITAEKPEGATAQYGPAKIFSGQYPANDTNAPSPPSGPLSVSTQGTTGPGGSVTSTAMVSQGQQPSPGLPTQPRGVGPGPVIADAVTATCTATEVNSATGEKSITGSTSVVNGILETKYDAMTQLPIQTEAIPANPAPNTTSGGTIDHVGDSYSVTYNEQITNPNGSLTVNGIHMRLLGPTAVGDLIIGSVTCGITTVGVPTSTTAGP
ncbi:MAG TPA: hypothetical protein VJ653_08290, partial [Acidimicrobiales bacterium]|nr:hypothetical protein [Acidimicrobiales bacterium]